MVCLQLLAAARGRGAPLLRMTQSSFVALIALLGILAATGQVGAQAFNPDAYYQSCLRSEASGNLEGARQNCLNALELRPEFAAASLALARIELAMGNTASAETRLNDISKTLQTAEVDLLSAEVALIGERYTEAEDALARAARRLEENPNSQLGGRLNSVQGQLQERQSHFQAALESYREAVNLDSLNAGYRLDLARLLYNLGSLEGAEAELNAYQELSGDVRDPEVLSLLGHVKWAQGRFSEAINNLETAVNRRGSQGGEAQTRDLTALSIIYYGQGNTRAGGLALRAVLRRGTSLLHLLGTNLAWILLLVAVLAIHLWGESHIAGRTSLEVVETPEMWRMGHIYSILFLALLGALVLTLVFSLLRYNNYLALFTPFQKTDTRAVYILGLTVILSILTVWRVRQNGWDPGEQLLGSAEETPLGFVTGLGLLAATFAYLYFTAGIAWLGDFYLNFARLTPLLIGAAILLPLNELFFRSFIIPALSRRYDPTLAILISGGVFALVLGTPTLLLLVFGLVLAEVFRRTNSGVNPLLAQLVLHIGLIIGVAFVPWVRGLFL